VSPEQTRHVQQAARAQQNGKLDSRRLTAGLKDQPGTFSLAGSDEEANRLLVGAGLEAAMGRNVSVALRFQSETGQDGVAQGAWGGVDGGF